MRIVIALLGFGLIALMLAEFFFTFLLPRRVRRDPRIARKAFAFLWRPWRAAAARLPPVASDTMLGIFGPLGLLFLLALWSFGLIIGFTALLWADRAHLLGAPTAHMSDYLFFSAGSFFSVSTQLYALHGFAKCLQICEAAAGFAVLFIAIGYLPALFQAFSRRESAVAQLDPRAGSPPSAGQLLDRAGKHGQWQGLNKYLEEWEIWAAELMETHLSYPALGFFRSQHTNQNWLAALTTIVDASAFALAYAPVGSVEAAEHTFAIGRHALADLAHSFHVKVSSAIPDRLPEQDLRRLCSQISESGLEFVQSPSAQNHLTQLRAGYERYAAAIANHLALPLARWLPDESVTANWRAATTSQQRGQPLP